MARKKVNGNGNKTAQRILTAAEELMAEVGYEGASARDIAARAGVNKALVFYHWGNKADLFEHVLQSYYIRHKQALEGALEGSGSLSERVHRVVDAYLDFIEANRLYPRLVQQQIAGGGTHLELVQRHLASFYQWTTRVLQEITPDQGPLAARHFYLSISGVVITYFTYGPVLGELWGQDPHCAEALAERRAHVHWLVQTLLERLELERGAGGEGE